VAELTLFFQFSPLCRLLITPFTFFPFPSIPSFVRSSHPLPRPTTIKVRPPTSARSPGNACFVHIRTPVVAAIIFSHFAVPGVNIADTLVPIADKIVAPMVSLSTVTWHSVTTFPTAALLFSHTRSSSRTSELHLLKTWLYGTLLYVFSKVAVLMVYSRLDYANSVVRGQTNVVQNSVARVLLKNSPNLSFRELLLKLHWLPIQLINK